MYTSYNYYESGYLMGRDPKLSEDEFPLWEKQAERVLNQYTFSPPGFQFRAYHR